jgi:hypothetical protein
VVVEVEVGVGVELVEPFQVHGLLEAEVEVVHKYPHRWLLLLLGLSFHL